jgi:hypothetical protein
MLTFGSHVQHPFPSNPRNRHRSLWYSWVLCSTNGLTKARNIWNTCLMYALRPRGDQVRVGPHMTNNLGHLSSITPMNITKTDVHTCMLEIAAIFGCVTVNWPPFMERSPLSWESVASSRTDFRRTYKFDSHTAKNRSYFQHTCMDIGLYDIHGCYARKMA